MDKPSRTGQQRVRTLPQLPEKRPAGLPAEMADLLGGLTDREDLARLFDRDVDLDTILRLMGRQVPRETIRSLLESPDPRAEARRILDQAGTAPSRIPS